jgi:integrase
MNVKLRKQLKAAKCIYAHGDALRIYFKLPGDKEYKKLSTGLHVSENNIELAKNRLASIKLDIASNLFDVDPDYFWKKHFPTNSINATVKATLKDYFHFYEQLREDELSLSSFSKIGTAKRWVKKHGLLNLDVKKITHVEIELLRKRALASLKWSTVSEYLRTLSSVLDEAVKDDRIQYNPFVKIRKMITDEDPTEDKDINPFTQDELIRLLDVVHITKTRDMIELLAWSGLRPGEMKALAWEDLDLVKGILHVRYNINRKGQLKPPKTSAGIRKIELMPFALEVLKRQREKTFMLPALKETVHLKYKRKKQVERRRIFLSRGNKPYKQPELTTVPKQWANWLRQAKLIHRPPYQLRHTFASQMLMASAEPIWLAGQMGHSDWGMIRKIYGKWIAGERPDHKMEIAKNLGQKFPHNSQEQKSQQ